MSLSELPLHGHPLANLRDYYPQLDIDTMLDRSNGGELPVDLTFSFNPNTSTAAPNPQPPLVGLWHLDVLEASFGAAGFNQGNLHPIGTLSPYRSLQAKMSKEHSWATHVTFCSTYTLQYRLTQPSDNIPFFAENSNAYDVNEQYMTKSDRHITLFCRDAKLRTYGVCDEYCMGGHTLIDIIEN